MKTSYHGSKDRQIAAKGISGKAKDQRFYPAAIEDSIKDTQAIKTTVTQVLKDLQHQIPQAKFDIALSIILVKTTELLLKKNLNPKYFEAAADAAIRLVTRLIILREQRFITHEIDARAFKVACNDAVKYERPILEKYHGWVKIMHDVIFVSPTMLPPGLPTLISNSITGDLSILRERQTMETERSSKNKI